MEIALINKKNLTRVFKKHLPEFQKQFGEAITAEEFLQRINLFGVLSEEVVGDKPHLLGIVLGYGAKNAELSENGLRTLFLLKKLPHLQLQNSKNSTDDWNRWKILLLPLFFLLTCLYSAATCSF